MNALTNRFAIALGGLALAALALTAGPAPAAERDNLDAALQKHAPAIIKHLREQKYQNVGVLKFLVKQDDAVPDNAGPLNLSIANRLEVALVLANPDEKLGIIERASAAVVRANNRRASHLTPEGRAALFQVREYALAWGDRKQVEPDAFLTGTVEVSRDGRTLTVTVEAFDRAGKEPHKVCTFTAAMDFRTLAETGRSYQLTARGPDESQLVTQAIDHAQIVSTRPEMHPLETGKSPVELRVLYNGSPVRISGGAVPEPRKDDRVSFVLVNKGAERCGVVLKVNGESTLFREPNEALQCHRWVLNPGEEVKIDGFQMGAKQTKKFEVLSPEESEKDMVNYGEHAGTFSLVVFREARAERDIVLPASHEITAIARGSLSPNGKKPGTLAALQAALKEKGGKAAEGQKGIIVPGEDGERPIQYVSFKPDPAPVLTATVRYWRPAR
jgi:hypothetical protein